MIKEDFGSMHLRFVAADRRPVPVPLAARCVGGLLFLLASPLFLLAGVLAMFMRENG